MVIKIPSQLWNNEFRFIKLQKKSKDPIVGIAWSKHLLKYNDKELLDWLEEDGNYGVVAGYGNLRILDIDDKDLAEKLITKIKTSTVKTCGKTYHFYLILDYDINHKLKNKMGEYRADNWYVVGPNCYAIDKKKNHEGPYAIINDLEISKISKDELFNLCPELNAATIIETDIELSPQIEVDKDFIEKNVFPKLKADMLDLILVKTPVIIGERSEIDQKVTTHLVLNGFEKYVKSIFGLYPIGIKYNEKGQSGDKYLKANIEEAKRYSGTTTDLIPILEQEIYSLPKNVLKNKIDVYLLKVSKIKDELQRVPIFELIKDKTKMSVRDLKERLNKLVYEKDEIKISSLRSLMSKEFKKPDYYIENILLKNSITLLAGKTGRFKTMFALILALSMTKGQKFLGEFEVKESPKILYYDLDENGELSFTTRTRYLLNGMKLNEDVLDRLHITHGFLSESLDKEIENAKEYDIIILDSYRRFLKGDENKSEVTNQFFKDYLAKLKQIGKTTIVLLHFKKADFEGLVFDDLLDAARGSSDIISQADVYYCLFKSEDEIDPSTKSRKFDVSVVAPKDRDGSVPNRFSFNVFKNVPAIKTELAFLGYKKAASKTTMNKTAVLEVITTEKRIKRHELLEKVKEKVETISDGTVDTILKQLAREKLIDDTEYGFYKIAGYVDPASIIKVDPQQTLDKIPTAAETRDPTTKARYKADIGKETDNLIAGRPRDEGLEENK